MSKAGVQSRNLVLPAASRRAILLIAATLAVAGVVWALVYLGLDRVGFAATVPPKIRGAEEAAAAFARLFAALALSLYPSDAIGKRLHWVAAGFVVTGVGHLFYGYLAPLLGTFYGADEGLLAGFLVRTLAGVLFVVGLFPGNAPRFSLKAALMVFIAACSGWFALEFALGLDVLPGMVAMEGMESVATGSGEGPIPGLTGWHWLFSLAPLSLAAVATVGAFRGMREGKVGGWLLVALVLLTASQLHSTLWPSAYGSPVLTSADLLRLGFAAVVAIGAALELRKIAAERAALLAEEKERTRAMKELSSMKADFTAMVAHELTSPLLAVRSYADMLASGKLAPERQANAVTRLQDQADRLSDLIEDVRTSASIENEDFGVAVRPVSVSGLLFDAASYTEALPGDHRFSVQNDINGVEVLADPARIGQVLRNLLSNASKHSPPGSEIELRAELVKNRVRISVSDRGCGIHPDDLERVFEKFGRGRDVEGRRVAGVGLGLYLSRRIALAHGSDLALRSVLGEGSTFSFELKMARKTHRKARG